MNMTLKHDFPNLIVTKIITIIIFQAPYIFADYTWFYIGIGATAGKAYAPKYY